MFFSICS